MARTDATARARLARAIGRNIQTHLARREMNQTELARRIDTGRHNVSQWCGGRFVPREPALRRMADVFGVSVEDLCSVGAQAAGEDGRNGATVAIDGPELRVVMLPDGRSAHVRLDAHLPAEAAIEILRILHRSRQPDERPHD